MLTYCGYILSSPNDTPERIQRDISMIQRDVLVELLLFLPHAFARLGEKLNQARTLTPASNLLREGG